MQPLKTLQNIDTSSIRIKETRNDDTIDVIDVITSDSGVTVLGKIRDRYFGDDGFFEDVKFDDVTRDLTIDVKIFFPIETFWLEDESFGAEPIQIRSDDGRIDKDYKFDYECSKLTDEHVKAYIDEIWIDYQDDFEVKFDGRMKE